MGGDSDSRYSGSGNDGDGSSGSDRGGDSSSCSSRLVVMVVGRNCIT